MQRIRLAIIASVSLVFLSGAEVAPLLAADAVSSQSSPWPQWRGAEQNGVAVGAGFPKSWAEKKGIAWKFDLPGRGGSTPVIAGQHALLTCGTNPGGEDPGAAGDNLLIAVDLQTGQQAWSAKLGSDRGGKHRKGSGANPSAVTNGKQVFAYFRSGDLGCVSIDGETQWHVNLQDKFGADTLWWDLGSSPTLINDLVVVAVMQSEISYVVALKQATGEVVWKVDRNLGAPREAAQSYATPIALEDRGMIAVMGADHLTVHSVTDGRELGRVGGFNPDQEQFFRSISSPVAVGDLIVCPYSRGATVTTCRISDVVEGKQRDSIVWHRDDLGSDVPTPAIHNGRLYVVGDSKASKGAISAVDVETGKTIWTVQIPKSRIGFSSSPLIADNHLYVTGEDATTYVIGPIDSEQPELLETNRLADNDPFTVSSLIPVGNDLLLRTKHSLYRLTK